MRKVVILVLAGIFLVLIALQLGNNWGDTGDEVSNKSLNETVEVLFMGRNGEKLGMVVAEVADDPGEIETGLSTRSELDSGRGMIFDLRRETYASFWMKNMSFPIDIVFVNSSGEIINIYTAFPENPPYRSYVSEEPSSYVVEVKAGFCEENGIEEGDKVRIVWN